MRSTRLAFALLLSTAVVGAVSAQTTYNHGRYQAGFVAPNPQALSALQLDLVNAIEAMKVALPIYDGNRVRAIHQAHEALVLVDQAIAGVNAAVRVKPVVKDSVASTAARTKYTKDQISSSQASMRKGYALLQQAWTDITAAAGSNPNKKAIKAGNHIKIAGAEATKAIAIHAAQV